jgi:hypothetical protein
MDRERKEIEQKLDGISRKDAKERQRVSHAKVQREVASSL